MSKRVIEFGKWNDKPIEWVVLKEEKYGALVISKWSVGARRFDGSSSRWESSELCKWLNDDFYNAAFSNDEKKKIVNTLLGDTKDVKNNVFILTRAEVGNLLLKDGSDEYEDRGYNSGSQCSYCVWTRTVNNNSAVQIGYAKGCWSCAPSVYNGHQVRPAMYLKGI